MLGYKTFLRASLQSKLSLTLFFLLMVIGLSTYMLGQRTANQYSLELYQRLNMPITMYMTDVQQFITNGVANKENLTQLADHVMVVNPSLEIYLLDAQGNIIAHPFTEDAVEMQSVNMFPIRTFLKREDTKLLLGDDPKNARQKNIFSVHPVVENGQTTGYLYAILAGKNFQNLLADVRSSNELANAGFMMFGFFLLALLSGVAAFYFLTRRLSQLTDTVKSIDINSDEYVREITLPKSRNNDEIDRLVHAFKQLLQKNQTQYQQLQTSDTNRRELIANISHDLRTPLTSMQGYIETLLIKDDQLSQIDKQEFLSTAHRQSKHLVKLVADLFELAKLDSGRVEPELEVFSLLELIYDMAQEFELKAQENQIKIAIDAREDVQIIADISMIQRVFENLLGNAIRYTPREGEISISIVNEENGHVSVSVANDGKAISEHEQKYIFNRYYRSQETPIGDNEQNHSGIGLAITKKILVLHKCDIRLNKDKRDGAEFIFQLPSLA